MFFHGIDYQYLLYQFPILSPRLTVMRQNEDQNKDRVHLIKQFGFEPVHFLESSYDYSIKRCIEDCFSFGNVVFALDQLPLPMLQLSKHEVGVPVVDVRKAKLIFVHEYPLLSSLKRLFPDISIIYPVDLHKIEKDRKIVRWRKLSNFGKIDDSREKISYFIHIQHRKMKHVRILG